MGDFIDKIRKQLERMKEKEKDEWILSQAKILPDWEQENFFKSLCGTKKVIGMPDRSEIAEFCKKVDAGDITVEYETHYVEFDDYGHYYGDWKQDYYDPNHAMTFISSVVRGCHDLIVLEEYKPALEILDEIIGLKFIIVDHPDTDDSCEDEFMNLNMAVEEGILLLHRDELLRDYIESCRCSVGDIRCAAEKIAKAFEMEFFKDCVTDYCISISATDPLLMELKKKLRDDFDRYKREYVNKIKKDKHYWDKYRDEERIRHISALIDYFGKSDKKEAQQASFLKGAWTQISELISDLMDEPYIDDQPEIDEVCDIVEALLKHGGFEKESWEVKKSILKEIYDNELYDCYGVADPMMDLVNAICTTREENLKRAEIMMKAGSGYFGPEAAKLYRELGEEDKCARYFEKHLGKEEEPYNILIDYYKDRDRAKAVEIASLAIQKCQYDQTAFFAFLLQDAKNRGDEATFKKLMQSAHGRRTVNSDAVDVLFL